MNLKPIALATTLVVSGALWAQEPPNPPATSMESTTTTKTQTHSDTKKSHKESVTGTVKSFEAGKSIKVMTAKKKTKSYTLDSKDVTTTVGPDVAVGKKVKVTKVTDPEGKKTLDVELAKS